MFLGSPAAAAKVSQVTEITLHAHMHTHTVERQARMFTDNSGATL